MTTQLVKFVNKLGNKSNFLKRVKKVPLWFFLMFRPGLWKIFCWSEYTRNWCDL